MKKLMSIMLIMTSMFLSACSQNNYKSDWQPEEIAAIASQVKQGEVVLYGSDDCHYCKQALAWLKENNFSYKYCEMNKSKACYKEYQALGGNGIPFLVINRHGSKQKMNDGFNSAQFLNLLQEQ